MQPEGLTKVTNNYSRRTAMLPQPLHEIYKEHFYELICLCVLFVTILLLHLERKSAFIVLPSLYRARRMPASSPQTVKLKSTLRLLIPRLRNAQKKDTALSIAARREMADLLSQSREESARIRVENIIHTDITVELMEILELYAELLLARAGLLDLRDKNVKEGLGAATDDTGLEEAAATMIYAAPRLPRDVRELVLVRAMLIERFGKDFALRAGEGVGVPDKVVTKLKIETPKPELVQGYLEVIAETYGVDWPRHKHELQQAQDEVDNEEQDDDEGDDGGAKEQPILADGAGVLPATPSKAQNWSLGPLPPKGQPSAEGAKSPVSVAPPGARSDNPSPKVKLPGGGAVKPQSQQRAGGVESKGGVGGMVPTVDDLAKRFQALKR